MILLGVVDMSSGQPRKLNSHLCKPNVGNIAKKE